MALAVSGGSDSMAMMGLAHDWAFQRARIPKLSVLTVDHGLRSASAAEAVVVAGRAVRLGLEHHTLLWNGPKPKTGLQAKAREARYELMTTWCRGNGATALLTAHTLDDQAETVLMRLARTTSIDSLAGIHPVAYWDGIKLVRPLLDQNRQQLRDYLRIRHHDWIEDPSNADERFERVRVRNALAGHASWRINGRKLADLAKECRDASGVLGELAQSYLTSSLMVHPQGFGTFPTSSFQLLHHTIRMRVLRRVIPFFGSGTMPLRAEIARVAEALMVPGTRRTLGGAILWARKSEIAVAREAGRIAEQPVFVPASGTVVWDGRYLVTAPPGSSVFPASLAPGLLVSGEVPHIVRLAEPAVQCAGQTAQIASYDPANPVHARFAPMRAL